MRLVATGNFVTGEFPSHSAVLQCDHAVLDAGIDQRLGPNDAAGASGTVDDDERVGVWCHLLHPMHEFGPGAVDSGWDAHVAILVHRP